MAPKKLNPNHSIKPDFLNHIPLEEIDLQDIEEKNKPGFEIEKWVQGFRVITHRVDWNRPSNRHEYYTLVYGTKMDNSAFKKSPNFQEAVRLHYSTVHYLEKNTKKIV